MSVEQVASGSTAASQFLSTSGGGAVTSIDSRDAAHNSATPSTRSTQTSILAQAVIQTLAVQDVSAATAAGGAANVAQLPVSAQQALQNFVQALGAAVHSAADSASGSASGTANTSATPGLQSHGRLEAGLEQLVSQLSDGGSSSPSSSSSSQGGLQQDFQNLLYALGQSGSDPTLQGFLQALSQNLQGSPSTGTVLSTQA